MAKGYWIARVDVRDPQAYQDYVAANAAAFARFGARFLVRGATPDTREGTSRTRNVVIEFPSVEAARACYESPEYAEALRLRLDPAVAVADLIIVEGYEGPQPGA